MAGEHYDGNPWNLATFATFHLGDSGDQVRPGEAGASCRRFVFESNVLMEDASSGEEKARYAEQQIATALIALATLSQKARRESRLPCRVCDWPIVVFHGARQREKYCILFENADWPRGRDFRCETMRYPVEGFDGDDAIRFLAARRPPRSSWPDSQLALLAAAVEELGRAWGTVPAIVMPRLARRLTATLPSSAGVSTAGGASASIGVVGTSQGQAVATTAAHAIGHSPTVDVNGVSFNVLQIDWVQDAAIFDASRLAIAGSSVLGPLTAGTPAGGATHHFTGAASGRGSDVVVAWDAAIPWVAPSLPVQAHVYTGCITQPGDSGAALVSQAGRVVGFAHFAVPHAAPSVPYPSASPGLSGWVWAESVFASLSII